MFRFEVVTGGVKKIKQGYEVIVYAKLIDECFSLAELALLIKDYEALPLDALTPFEENLLPALKLRRKTLVALTQP